MKLLATLIVISLPFGLATPVAQEFGQPTRVVIVGPTASAKPPKDRCAYGRYICELAGEKKYCSKEYVKYMEACLETGCVQFFRDPLTDCKKKHGHGKDDHEDDDDDEDEDDGGPIREVIWSA